MTAHPLEGLPLRPDRKSRYIFCDESGLNDRFFVLGSLHSPSNPDGFRADLDAIKREYWLRGEIKWESLPTKPGTFINGYKAVIERFLDSPLTYKALIVDTYRHPLNHPQFTGRKHGIGYYQFYLTLLFNGLIRYEPAFNSRILIHTPAYELQGGLTRVEREINEIAIKHGFPEMCGYSCCHVLAQSSKKDSILQLTDILTGLISAIWNGAIFHPTKREVLSMCSDKLQIDITQPSASRHVDKKFNRWVFSPSNDREGVTKWPALYPPTK